jgi:alanyl-tRNA synthetase
MEDVGDNRHTTFFEMLGDWSLDGFDKAEQLKFSFDFLTKELGLDPNKIYVTCFIGDEEHGIPRDTEAAEVWQKLFEGAGVEAKIVEMGSAKHGDERGILPGERIFFYDDKENWWSRNGGIATTPKGDPCGPDSEFFYDFGESAHDPSFGKAHPASDSGRFIEIGNKVFMQYRRLENGEFEALEKGKIDQGDGLSRLAAATLDTPDIFKTDLYTPIIARLEEMSGKNYDSNAASMRVIADHLTGATWLASQNLAPSNKEQGYIMRRLMRRAIRFAFDLGIEQNFLEEIIPVILDIYAADYPHITTMRDTVIATLAKEEKAFRQTLRKGLKEFERLVDDCHSNNSQCHSEPLHCHSELVSESNGKNDEILNQVQDDKLKANKLTGNEIFTLYDTYGFPVELSVEEAFKRNIPVSENWRTEFDQLMQKQREMSQTAAKGTFKGGLGGQTWQHRRYHTATHLLQSALRKIFGSDLRQHGSNITEERLRFDFNLDHKMTEDEIKRAEDLVNGWIEQDLPIWWQEYPTETALEMGAIGPFGERYADKVRVYQMGEGDKMASLEICGGPHCEHTGQLAETGDLDNSTDAPQNKPIDQKTDFSKLEKPAKFKIIKEESSSAGIRRIKAVLK